LITTSAKTKNIVRSV